MGGTVRAFAIELNGDGSRSEFAASLDGLDVAAARDRKIPDGVGKLVGALRCRVAERSSRVATGVVSGRKCEW